MSDLFFKIYRNSFLKYKICSCVRFGALKDITITLECFIKDIERVLHLSQYCNLTLYVTKGDFYSYSEKFISSPQENKYGIRYVTLRHDFDIQLPCGFIPDGVEGFDMGYRFSQPLSIGVFPSSLKTVRCSYYFNFLLHQMVDGVAVSVFPTDLESLTIGDRFERMCPILPSGLKKLKIGRLFGDDIGYLEKLESLSAPLAWIHNEKNSVPASVTSLKILNDQYRPTDERDVLEFLWTKYPRNLKKLQLTLSDAIHKFQFKQDSFPSSLVKLDLRSPNNLGYLHLHHDDYDDCVNVVNQNNSLKQLDFPYWKLVKSMVVTDNVRSTKACCIIPNGVQELGLLTHLLTTTPIPPSVTSLTLDHIDRSFNIPPNVTYLKYHSDNDLCSINTDWDLSGIRKVKILSDSCQDIETPLPHVRYISLPKIVPLNMGYINKRVSPGMIPNTVTRLHISWCNDFVLRDVVPPSVTHLKLWLPYIPLPKDIVPMHIKKLILFNAAALDPGSLPSNLQYLSFEKGYQYPIQPNTLPDSLTILKNINNIILNNQCILPPNLEKLTLSPTGYKEFINHSQLLKKAGLSEYIDSIVCSL
ncbi:hypothetical protein CYY_003156 [Polysphondylium violaceum]|uniref:Uncharacterized protein n=1 Tax=Polysphondylium violaceum TaxID=133409 RepID=A0A8J4PY33_9MYCE|nr:hypothetical protein CYY_003156 [Polysphondylium violaceum]